ncbi:uncharacterized protein LOC118186491 [Stegodyphus dumicola]|uniref:uncharacterized protein LOC118186491 n=1 Tax=Stegodyphus dumicola TaxID=202533 RepID=UPI0015AB6D2E|nr:uncharacterized protein LOC118186491 [Stegodyphus dumicola]
MVFHNVRTIFFAKCALMILFLVASLTAFTQSGNYAVLRGSTTRISCFSPEVQVNEVRHSGDSFIWTDENGIEIINARFTKLKNGDLEISNVHIGDSGVYKCKYRSPIYDNTTGEASELFEHRLIVYEISGHKFVSRVFLDMSESSVELTLPLLRDIMAAKVCGYELCLLGPIQLLKCELLETKKQVCEFSISYEAVNQMADERCDENCVRESKYEGLKKAEKILIAQLQSLSSNPKSGLKADMNTFDTKHMATCRAGFHFVKSFFKRCFPCRPGTYSRNNSKRCDLCNIGFYQEHYGKHDCDRCEEGKTTDNLGAQSKDDCVPIEGQGLLNDIKNGIVSLFTGGNSRL